MNRQPHQETDEPSAKLSTPHARICWSHEVSKLKKEDTTASRWTRADHAAMEQLRAMCEAGNVIYGPGSHWVELQNASSMSPP